MAANLEKYSATIQKAAEVARSLSEGEEHVESLGEEVRTAVLRVGVIAAVQQELGHGYIVSLLTHPGQDTSIKVKKAQ